MSDTSGVSAAGAAPPAAAPVADLSDNNNYKTEFHRLVGEFPTYLKEFGQKHPITTVVALVALAILGFACFTSFHYPAVMITGALIFGLGTLYVIGIVKEADTFWTAIKDSLSSIKKCIFGGEKAEPTPATPEA